MLVTFGVVSILMLLPSGIQAQQQARFQIHAAVLMQNMTKKLSTQGQNNQMYNVQVESERLTNNFYLDRAAPSLEGVAEAGNIQLAPLPVDIAQRLDSDNDEINRIVSEGGRIYYNLPGGPPQGLIVGFVGYQQQNALPNHPCLAWPYWEHHPCAPSAWERQNWQLNPWPGRAEFNALFAVFRNGAAHLTTQEAVTVTKWEDYKRAAVALAQAVAAEPNSGLTFTTHVRGPVLNPPMPFPPRSGGPLGPWTASTEAERRNLYPKPYVVWAASHLAHAAAFGTGTVWGRNVGPGNPGTQADADDIDYARRCYESCRQWVMRMSTVDPYNWGVARQLAQQTAWDFPLMQHDLFPAGGFPVYTDPFSDPVVVPPDPPRHDTAWRVLAPQRAHHDGSLLTRLVDDYGQARGQYGLPNPPVSLGPNKPNIDEGWGNPAHFHLTRRFDPSERMRQVVFWSVDWQAYEDFEAVPAPLHDAAMGFRDSYGTQVCADWWGISLPERDLYWITAARDVTGFLRHSTVTWQNQFFDPFCDSSAYKSGYFMGMHGADRNGNGRFDRGSVPKSVRLRATQVARFTVYDRILQGEHRH